MKLLMPSMPARRSSELYTLMRERDIQTRYETFKEEVNHVQKKFRRDPLTKQAIIKESVNWDVASGVGGISETLREEEGMTITTLDKDPDMSADIIADWSCPREYAEHGRPDIIWASFQYNLVDQAIPQAYALAKEGVIMHVPCDYLTNRPHYRTEFLKEIARSGEVRVISNMDIPKGRRGVRRCQWVLLYKSRKTFAKHFCWPRVPVLTSGRLTFSE